MRRVAISVLALAASWHAYADEPLPSPEILQVIRSADKVYVFPYTSGERPRTDQKHLRLLDADARDSLKRLLGNDQNWNHGLLTIAEPLGLHSAGVLFRTQADELLLLFDPTTISGTFHGKPYYGALAFAEENEQKPHEELQKWKEHYARPEIRNK